MTAPTADGELTPLRDGLPQCDVWRQRLVGEEPAAVIRRGVVGGEPLLDDPALKGVAVLDGHDGVQHDLEGHRVQEGLGATSESPSPSTAAGAAPATAIT
eukprot:CAMPEP_0182928596 /NCGR_PEP_ID=MMETSP0105_2-20130417/15668_1 /TAXON_ID=81532 ORGANISM="Acanthoeca-like sp., Strain 10tr" /NCGR_SAMPLE_ID=MMETSP0105_2 /ASSEMBLY_ACC=CAM_ASM_000205 /LENGTH=99 /DNA_ID=CAMNT_0025066601 /DNA_START=40 /DNA_END=341 /DNA_ORIENTATION=+